MKLYKVTLEQHMRWISDESLGKSAVKDSMLTCLHAVSEVTTCFFVSVLGYIFKWISSSYFVARDQVNLILILIAIFNKQQPVQQVGDITKVNDCKDKDAERVGQRSRHKEVVH